jgi:hypothetical protein
MGQIVLLVLWLIAVVASARPAQSIWLSVTATWCFLDPGNLVTEDPQVAAAAR